MHQKVIPVPDIFPLIILLGGMVVERGCLEKAVVWTFLVRVAQNHSALGMELDLLVEHIQDSRPWKLCIVTNSTRLC